MPNSWQIDCLSARIRSLKSEIKRVADKDHPYPEPDTIYKALMEVVKARSELFEDAVELLSGRELQATFDSILIDLARVAEEFSLADRVDSARIPFEILRALSWVANVLFKEECRTVVRLDTVQNYTLSSCRQRFEDLGWGNHWTRALRTNGHGNRPFTVLVLGFPSADANSILLHALSAHEFGHQFAHRNDVKLGEIRDQLVVDAKRLFSEKLQDYIADSSLKREGVSAGDAYEEGRRLVELRLLKLTKNWLIEIFSDFVAARLVGPAFLPALDRISLELGNASPSHPPGYLRRQLVREYLQGILPEIASDPVWEPFFRRAETPSVGLGINRDRDQRDAWQPLYEMGAAVCRDSLQELSEVLELVPCTFRSIDGYSLLVTKMEDCLANLTPPSVVLDLKGDESDAPNFWLLMYSTWRFRLDAVKFASFASQQGWERDLGRAEEVLGNLLLQSLQSLELRHQWEQWGATKGTPSQGGRDF